MSKFNYSEVLDIKNIKDSINFWLVRSKGGVFYDEFKREKYIALGWNYIDSKNIYESSEEKLKNIKEEIERIYKNKQGGAIFNKCDRFINEMNEGDIVMVPSSENNEILFATVGAYYENNQDYIHELEIINRIDSKEDYGIEIKCPYKKRRKIIPIKTIKGERLNPNLFRALTSYHGISNINKYSDFVLSSIYNLYVRNNKLNMVVNIEEKNGIDGYDFSSLIYNICKMAKISDHNVRVTTQANVNSPGDVNNIIETANNIFDFIKDNWIGILIMYGAFCGIKIGPIQINSFIEFIIKSINAKKEIDHKEALTEGVLLDNKIKEFELEVKKSNWNDEKLRKAKEIANNIEKSATSLKVDKEASSRVIKVDFKTNDE